MPLTENQYRGVDVLGTTALPTNEAAMQEWAALTQLPEGLEDHPPLMSRMPTGQVERRNWVVKDIQDQERDSKYGEPDNTDFAYTYKGSFGPSGYDDMSKFTIRKNRPDGKKPHINSNNLKLTYHEEIRNNWQAFQQLRESLGREDDLAMLVGLPSHIELAMFMLASNHNPVPALANIEPFRRAYQMQVDRIWNDPAIGTHQDKNRDLVWQIEMPVITALIAKAERTTLGAISPGDQLAKRVIAPQVEGLPEGARVVGHPCYGDYYGKYYTKRHIGAIVAQTESMLGYWPEGRTLEGLHFPFGAGQVPPSVNSKDYKEVRRLATILGPETDLIAGIVHYDPSYTPQQHFDVRNMIEDEFGRKVRISYYCGYGRTKPRVARLMTQRCVDLSLNEKPTELSNRVLPITL